MKARRMAEIVGCERVLLLLEENWRKKTEELMEAYKRENESIIARIQLGIITLPAESEAEIEGARDKSLAEIDAAATAFENLTNLTNTKKAGVLTEVSALDALTAVLEVTPCLDIGGIRRPLGCGIYNLSDKSHITLNSDRNAVPNFLFARGLNFGKMLGTFPELSAILLRRGAPINCLISHVGVNIFDDVMGGQLGKESCSFDDMAINYEVLAGILPEFISNFAAFLKLFKGGRFTYKSLKKDPDEDHQGYFSKDMRSMRAQPIENYTCMSDRECVALAHFSFVPDVDDLCLHEALFRKILRNVLDLKATTKINYVGESVVIYSQTVVDIPGKFTGVINLDKLKEVIQWFLSQTTAATTAACSGPVRRINTNTRVLSNLGCPSNKKVSVVFLLFPKK